MNENGIWRELEFTCNGGGGCVMVEKVAGCIVIWDSKVPQSPRLIFSRKEYAAFRRRVQGEGWLRAVARLMLSLPHLMALGMGQLVH